MENSDVANLNFSQKIKIMLNRGIGHIYSFILSKNQVMVSQIGYNFAGIIDGIIDVIWI